MARPASMPASSPFSASARPLPASIARMAAQEKEHLRHFDAMLAARGVRPTLLQPVWAVAGHALGAATALIGPEAAMACTAAIEDEIDAHYSEQLEALGDSDPALSASIARFQADEREHRDIALAGRRRAKPSLSAALFRDPRGLPCRHRAFEEDLNHAHRPHRPCRRARRRAALSRSSPASRSPAPPSRSGPDDVRVNQLIIYGDDPCPQSQDPNEVTVCARLPDDDRYRVPPNLRENPNDPAQPGLG